MFDSDHFFRYEGVNGKRFLLAIKHNTRELQKECGSKGNIDANRTHLNYSLHGLKSSQAIDRYARSLIALAGITTVRKNAVWAVEVIYSLPISWHEKESKSFFKDCYEWTMKSFDGELLSFDVHLDESAPHAHALILPLIDGKMQGDKLKGDRKKVKERRKLYYEGVASTYGFKIPLRETLNQSDKVELAKEVLKHLGNDSVLNSAVFPCIRDQIFANPVQYAQLLGIPLKSDRKTTTKSFVDIKRSKGRGQFIR